MAAVTFIVWWGAAMSAPWHGSECWEKLLSGPVDRVEA